MVATPDALRGHLMIEYLAYSSKAVIVHLCENCAAPAERVSTGKLGFRAFRCPRCSHVEERRIDTGVIPRSDRRLAGYPREPKPN